MIMNNFGCDFVWVKVSTEVSEEESKDQTSFTYLLSPLTIYDLLYRVFTPTNTKIFINAVLKVHFAHFIFTVAE